MVDLFEDRFIFFLFFIFVGVDIFGFWNVVVRWIRGG